MPVGINYNAGVSAQLKKCCNVSWIKFLWEYNIIETEKVRDHTENMLLKISKVLKIKNNRQKIITIFG
jgi:hypothetical protein